MAQPAKETTRRTSPDRARKTAVLIFIMVSVLFSLSLFICNYVVSRHVEGDVVKFYGVSAPPVLEGQGRGFFRKSRRLWQLFQPRGRRPLGCGSGGD